ncbi:hypothetical protein OC834_003050 [Tilletia horrida]|nr:hypothetical protein OC834_003050 [Tilletia horrida]
MGTETSPRSRSSTSSSLTSLPSTPSIRADPPQTPSASGSGPRARGYPEGMFSTPSRRMVPVVVIPTSEPRIDEVSGVSDGLSSLSSLSRSRMGSAIRSPRHFTAAQKRRRINDSASPLSRMNRAPSSDNDDDGDDDEDEDGEDDKEEQSEDGDETITNAAQAAGRSARKRARRSTSESTSAQPPEPRDEDGSSYDDSDEDDDLPDILPTARAPNTTRIQPKRAAVTDGKASGSGSCAGRVLPSAAAHVPPPSKKFRSTGGMDLSIAGLLRRKKQAANQGTDLDGMREADALLRETEARETEELRLKAKREAAEHERKEVEAMQRELDLSFLSPPSRKASAASVAFTGLSATAADGAGKTDGDSKRKVSEALLKGRHVPKAEGGCMSDGLEDYSDSSESDSGSGDEADSKARRQGTTDDDGFDPKAAGRKLLLSGMSRTLQSVDLQGRDVLVDIIAADHGFQKDVKGKKAAKAEAGGNGEPKAPSCLWLPGRVELHQVVVPTTLSGSRFGKLIAKAARQGPWALASLLQQVAQAVPHCPIATTELSFIMTLAVHGLDSVSVLSIPEASSSVKLSNVAPEGIPAAHPWRAARVERQAVATAACSAVDAISRRRANERLQGTSSTASATDDLLTRWLSESLLSLGASPLALKSLEMLSDELSAEIKMQRQVRRQERQKLSRLAAKAGRDNELDRSMVKKEEGNEQSIQLAVQRGGWLSLDERMEAVTRLCSVVRAFASRGLLSWEARIDALLALAGLATSHTEDGMAKTLEETNAALLDDPEDDLSAQLHHHLDEAAARFFKAFRLWPVTAYASVLRGLPKLTIRTRAFGRKAAWLMLEQRHASLRKTAKEKQTRASTVLDADSVISGVALPNLAVIQDLILTSNDSSPFWVSTSADDARKAKAASGQSSAAVAGEVRRVTDYAELAAWMDIVNIALTDVAIQASIFKKSLGVQQTSGAKDDTQKMKRQAKAAHILATRPLVSSLALTLDPTRKAGDPLPIPAPNVARVQALQSILEGLRTACNKIIDYRGMNPDRSKAKDAIQRAQIRLYYLVRFYFATGEMQDELRLHEIYGKQETKEDKAEGEADGSD